MEKKEDKLNGYEAFVEKFKRKLTTDDCYTPQHVYEVIVDWLSKKCSFNRMHIIRPFYPDKDYKATDYYSGSVVIDNPPFSILAEILRFYNEHNIYFFLFCPHLTSFQNADKGTVIVADITIEYENGAKICTDFITNFPEFTEYVAITSPELRLAIEDVQKKRIKSLPKREIYISKERSHVYIFRADYTKRCRNKDTKGRKLYNRSSRLSETNEKDYIRSRDIGFE